MFSVMFHQMYQENGPEFSPQKFETHDAAVLYGEQLMLRSPNTMYSYKVISLD